MLFRRLSQFLTAAALAIAFVAFAGVGGGSEAKAQGFYRNYDRHRDWDRDDFRRHDERERFYWQRRRERERDYWNWRRHERFERDRYYNRPGRYPYYRRW